MDRADVINPSRSPFSRRQVKFLADKIDHQNQMNERYDHGSYEAIKPIAMLAPKKIRRMRDMIMVVMKQSFKQLQC